MGEDRPLQGLGGSAVTINETQHLRILVLAPQPFFQNRGTPIATKLLVEELAGLGHDVHLLVFAEGEDIIIPGLPFTVLQGFPGYVTFRPPYHGRRLFATKVCFSKPSASIEGFRLIFSMRSKKLCSWRKY